MFYSPDMHVMIMILICDTYIHHYELRERKHTAVPTPTIVAPKFLYRSLHVVYITLILHSQIISDFYNYITMIHIR